MSNWVNRADDIYVKEKGKETFEERRKIQFIAPTQWFPSADLSLMTAGLGGVFIAATVGAKGRPPHRAGVGLKGHAQVVAQHDLHGDSFVYFRPNKKFSLNVRLSSAKDDDLQKDCKALAMELIDPDGGQVANFILQTGELAIVSNLEDMIAHLRAVFKGTEEAMKQWLLSKPQLLKAALAGFRRCPESFSDQRYYSQMTYEAHGPMCYKKLARFRVIPTDGRPETGLLSDEEQSNIWHRVTLPNETRSKFYLGDEIIDHVKSEELKFTLQYQTREIDENTTEETYNPAIPWSDVTSPWKDLMVLTLNSPLSTDETRRLKFNVQNLPPCLGFKEAYSRYDSASVPYARGKIYAASQKLRKWMDW